MGTIYERKGIYYAQYTVGKKQIRHSLRTRDEVEAKGRLKALTARRADIVETPADHPHDLGIPWPAVVREGLSNSGSWLSTLYQRTKDRASHRRVPFHLTKPQLLDIAMRSGGKCEFSQVAFSWDRPQGVLFPPFAPSLDRIKPSAGYNSGNCRLIAYAANVALHDWGPDPFVHIAASYFRSLGYKV